ncbi:MAG: 16S rRNA (uracil(1498)-N(3))-methyltransferase [Hyphomicrobiales bacterium]|nr:16S rRNA (uracil(1498)-N(3))-methyltransferase [Hyphomicrobiales bacterium]
MPDRTTGTKARLYVDADLAEGAVVEVAGAAGHYLASVMRARPGDAVALCNGRDGEWRARVEAVGRRGATLRLDSRTRPQEPEPDLWLCFAPLKKTATDFVVEKATELGASRLVPVVTRRTAAARVNTERLRATAREAAEQCERLTLPAVDPPVTLDRLLADWPAGRTLLFLDETGGGAPLAGVLAGTGAAPLAVLVGPEGGFDGDELAALGRAPCAVAAGLGPRILRAETAALAALTLCQALRGDWRRGPRGTT